MTLLVYPPYSTKAEHCVRYKDEGSHFPINDNIRTCIWQYLCVDILIFFNKKSSKTERKKRDTILFSIAWLYFRMCLDFFIAFVISLKELMPSLYYCISPNTRRRKLEKERRRESFFPFERRRSDYIGETDICTGQAKEALTSATTLKMLRELSLECRMHECL